MFTGIVEALGTISSISPLDSTSSGGGGYSFTISNCRNILHDAKLGDSICVNGTCLTVTELPSDGDSFKVGIAPETLRRTNLGRLKEQSQVNLEPALLPNTRLGGHFLQGHVDTVATIVETRKDGNAITFRLAPREQSVLRYIVEKGFISLDGASLTVCDVHDGTTPEGAQANESTQGWFEIMMIAYTQEKVVMAKKGKGDEVNVEVDMVGKYVEKSVASYFEGKGGTGNMAILEKVVDRVLQEKMKSMGK